MTGKSTTQRRAAAAKPAAKTPAPSGTKQKLKPKPKVQKPRKSQQQQQQQPQEQKPDRPRRQLKPRKASAKSPLTVEAVEVASDDEGPEATISADASEEESEMDFKHARGLQELEERVSDVRESCWTSESLFEDVIEGVEDAKFDPQGWSLFPSHSLTHSLNPHYVYLMNHR